MSNKEKRTKWILEHRYACYVISATYFSLCLAIGLAIFSDDNFNWLESIRVFLLTYWIAYPLSFSMYESFKKKIEKSQNKEK